MKKLQSIVSIAVMAMMLAVGFVGLTGGAAAQGNYIQANDLGIQYAAPTGLGSRDVRATVASIIKVALGLLGIVAVVIILIGGFTWMTAGGNDERVGQAKKWIFSGIIGLAIILSAYALATWVINSLVQATTSN